jgi:hypothetical protein
VSDMDDIGGCLGTVFVFSLVATAIVIAVMALMSVGVVFGAGISLKNYYQAFVNNVQPERAVP